jgi:NAD(P)-dependent dehydrogenase (short-subunit alcohol dehydrogenase family)
MTHPSAQPRTIVITGGGAGIGRATALLCAERGDSIAILDKNGDAAKSAALEAMARGARQALGLPCDVTVEQQVEESFQTVTAELGAPYGLFANAGMGRQVTDGNGTLQYTPLNIVGIQKCSSQSVIPVCYLPSRIPASLSTLPMKHRFPVREQRLVLEDNLYWLWIGTFKTMS